MPIPCAVLMCHAPIVVPEVGGEHAPECAGTTRAMAEAAQRVIAHQPDAVALVSPHAPRDHYRFGVCSAALLRGDFGRFGAQSAGVQLPGAPALAAALRRAASAHDIGTWNLSGHELDHGALVPLYFLQQAGWNGPTLLVSLPYPGSAPAAALGRALADAARQLGRRVCVIASGGMSHRLAPDAPAGYHPRAREFDARYSALIARGALRDAAQIDRGLRELAAEDVVDSCAVAASAAGFDARGHRIIHYEHPFGVGYLEAVLHDTFDDGAPQPAPLEGGDAIG